MRILKIAYNDLKNFLFQRTFLFIALFLSLILTSFTFSVFISDRVQISKIINTVANATNKYFIGNKDGINNEKIEKLETWLKENNISGYKINLYSDILLRNDLDTLVYQEEQISREELPEGSISGIRVKKIDGIVEKPYNIIIGSNNNESAQISFIGKTINEDDIQNKSNYIMLDYNSSIAKKNLFVLNDSITIRNKEYIVKAINGINLTPEIFEYCNYSNYDASTIKNIDPVVIPITTFVNDNNMIFGLDIIVPDNMSIDKKDKFNNFIQENFIESTILEPQKAKNVQLSDVNKYIIIYSILIILVLINILALLIYWIDINWRKYMIYRICGASKSIIFKIILLEAFIIGIISIFIGNILYYIKALLFNSMLLDLRDICIFQFIILILIMVLTSIEGVKILKRSPRYMERR